MPSDAGLWTALLAGIFGLLIGSFLNVCIHRWPRDLSVVRPRSMCPDCEHPIAWYDNIPLLSYAVLRGRCRHCGARVSWRYPLVEAVTAASFFYFVWQAGGLTAGAVKLCFFSAVLIALIFSDLETLLLPDELTLGGLCAGLAIAWFVPVPDATLAFFTGIAARNPRLASFGAAALGAIVPSAALFLTGWLFEKVRHKEGLGLGDVKMIATIGAFLGLGGALLSLALGAIVGALAGIIWIVASRKDVATYPLPFGAFLGAAALAVAAEGAHILAWYGGLLGF